MSSSSSFFWAARRQWHHSPFLVFLVFLSWPQLLADAFRQLQRPTIAYEGTFTVLKQQSRNLLVRRRG
jgi:hypothetical protein